MRDVLLYTTTWCGDCHRTKRRLDEMGIPYKEVNIEEHPDAVDVVLKHNAGKRRVPTMLIDGVFHATLPESLACTKV